LAISAKVTLFAVGMTIFADIIATAKRTMQRNKNHGKKENGRIMGEKNNEFKKTIQEQFNNSKTLPERSGATMAMLRALMCSMTFKPMVLVQVPKRF